MELLFGTATSQFMNQRIGSVDRGQRFSGPVQVMKELAFMGLVTLDGSAQGKKDVFQDAGKAKPLSALPADPASPMKTAEKSNKRAYKKKLK